jgi:hypothetical protein
MASPGSAALWHPVRDELERWQAAGRVVRLWLRDDDLVEVTPALERLAALARRYDAPVLMAAIPAGAREDLAGYFAAAPLLDPAVHGFAHVNHARPGERTEEFPAHRGEHVIREEIGRGLARLSTLFGARLMPIYVPPWNRIAPGVASLLPGLGLTALSAFGRRVLLPPDSGLAEVNAHVDIIHWKGNRGGREHGWLARELALELGRARSEVTHVGILTHHLVHDETAWSFLDALLEATAGHPAVRWVRAMELVDPRAGRTPAARRS